MPNWNVNVLSDRSSSSRATPDPEPVAGESESRSPVLPAIAKKPIAMITVIVAIVHLILAATSDYWVDEGYMIAAGEFHPSLGYVDQPPVVPMIAAAMQWLGQGSLFVVRLPAVGATVAGVLLSALLAREFGGGRRAQVWTAFAYATGMWITLVGHWLTPYNLEPALWALLCWLLVRWIRLHRAGRADDRLLLLLGVVIGVTAETKFQLFLFCAALLVSVLAVGPRNLLRRPKFWAGALIAAVLAVPTLTWQAMHGWPQLAMGELVKSDSEALSGGRLGALLGMVGYAGVVGTLLLLVGVGRLLCATELRPYRLFAVSFLLLFVFFVVTSGRPYYLTGLYPVLMAAGAVGFQRVRESKGTKYSVIITCLAVPLSLAGAALAGVWLSASATLDAQFGVRSTAVLARQIDAGYHRIPEPRRDHTAVLTQSFYVAAFNDVYRTATGMPGAYSPHRGYGYFPIPGKTITSVLWVAQDPGQLRPFFAEIRPVAIRGQKMWLCAGRTRPWSAIWPAIRRL